eukprot:461994-Hanusia_phi.AAC.3
MCASESNSRDLGRLNSLRSLRSLKTTDGKSTLIHYLAAFLQVRCPDALKILDSSEIIQSAVKALQRLEVSLPKFCGLWRAIRMSDGLENISPEAVELEIQYVKYFRPKFEEAVHRISSEIFHVKRRRHLEDHDLEVEKFLLNAMSNLQIFLADLEHACKSVSPDVFNRLSDSVQGVEFWLTVLSIYRSVVLDNLALLTVQSESHLQGTCDMLGKLHPLTNSTNTQNADDQIRQHDHVGEIEVEDQTLAPEAFPAFHSLANSLQPPPPPPPPPLPRSEASKAASKPTTSGPYATLPCQEIFKKQFRTKTFNWAASCQHPTGRSFWSNTYAPTILDTDMAALGELFKEQTAEMEAKAANSASNFSPPWYLRGVVVGKATNQGMGRITNLWTEETLDSKHEMKKGFQCPNLTRLEQEIETCIKDIVGAANRSHTNVGMEKHINDSASLLLEGFQIVLGVKYEREEMAKLFADDLARRAMNEESMGRMDESLKCLRTSSQLWPDGPAKVALRTFMTRNPLTDLQTSHSSLDDLSSFLLDVFDKKNFDRVAKKIELLNFCLEVPKLLSDCKSLDALYAEILSCESLRYCLRMVLAMGNFLNQHRSNPVEGFTLASITSLKDVRSRDGRNLYHVLYIAMDRYCNERLDVLLDLRPKLQAVARIEERFHKGQIGEIVDLVSSVMNSENPDSLLNDRFVELCQELKQCYDGLQERAKSSRKWFSVPDTHSVLLLAKDFVTGIESAGRDLRWAQIMHPSGTRALVRNVRSDLWSRINEIDCLQVSLSNRRFSKISSHLVNLLNSRFRLSEEFRYKERDQNQTLQDPSASDLTQNVQTVQVRVIVVGVEEFHLAFPVVSRFSEIFATIAERLHVTSNQLSASLSGERVDELEALQDRTSGDRCTLMVNLRQAPNPSSTDDANQQLQRFLMSIFRSTPPKSFPCPLPPPANLPHPVSLLSVLALFLSFQSPA